MAPSNSRHQDIKEENRLIAVLLTENFNNNFQPLTSSDPLALFPLANTPLLDYSLDWLQRYEVHETIVYCCAQPYAERIRDHCKEWSVRQGNFMKIIVISSENCLSLGDALRDLYSKSIVKKDFILLTGDVVGNLDLRSLIEKHRASRKKDPSSVMSCVYLLNKEKWRQLDECRLINIVVNSRTGKILIHKRPGNSNKLALNIPEVLQVGLNYKIYCKIEDPNIAICSELIPSLFSDNFDYDSRDSLVQGIIEQEELLGYSIHAQIMEDGYASRISSFRAYQEISEAVIKRLNFPSVPERSLSSHRIRYSFQSFSGNYWDSSAKFHKKSIDNYVVIDAGTEIDARAKITNSVIGKHCIIKENVSIKDSFILSNVIVSQGCILESCFVGNNVKLLPGVNLEPGVVVGQNVVLGPNLKVNRSSRLMVLPHTKVPQTAKLDMKLCGKEGNAYLYQRDLDEELSLTFEWGATNEEILKERLCNENSSSDDEGDSDNAEPDEEDDMSDTEKAEKEFIKEVNDSLLNGMREKSAIENIILEINSSRHAYNVSMDDVLTAVTKGLLHVGEDLVGEKLVGEELWDALQSGLVAFADVLRNYVKKPKDQINVLNAIEERVNEDRRLLPVLQKTLYELNQELEIIDDEVICFWYSKGGSTPTFPAIAKCIDKFVKWLEENEDSDED